MIQPEKQKKLQCNNFCNEHKIQKKMELINYQ
jgi:hypothetical protein